MNDSHKVQYDIFMPNKIKGEGHIEDIKNIYLNRRFVLYSHEDNAFEVQLRFQKPSILTQIKMRLVNTHRYELKLINLRNLQVQKFHDCINKDQKQISIIPKQCQPISQAKLKIFNHPVHQERLGICYILFQGINDEVNKEKNKQIIIKKQKSDNRMLIKEKTDSKKDQSREIFKKRTKKAEQQVEQLLSLMDDVNPSNPKKKTKKQNDFYQSTQQSHLKYKKQAEIRNKQQYQWNLAIALSKSQQEVQQNKENHESRQKQIREKQYSELPLALLNYLEEKNLVEPERSYQIIQFSEEYINYFSEFSSKWLDAQRKAEEQFKVRQDERLSSFVKLKHLNGMQIYITGFEEWMRDNYVNQAKILGCKMIDEIKNSCLVIASKQQASRLIKKHKQWKEVKYLIPSYLEDCIQNQVKLDMKKYYLKI